MLKEPRLQSPALKYYDGLIDQILELYPEAKWNDHDKLVEYNTVYYGNYKTLYLVVLTDLTILRRSEQTIIDNTYNYQKVHSIQEVAQKVSENQATLVQFEKDVAIESNRKSLLTPEEYIAEKVHHYETFDNDAIKNWIEIMLTFRSGEEIKEHTVLREEEGNKYIEYTLILS